MCISIFSPAKTFLLAVLVNKYKFPFFKKIPVLPSLILKTWRRNRKFECAFKQNPVTLLQRAAPFSPCR
jgi:hypothetical protein